jgi:hypothetical protein
MRLSHLLCRSEFPDLDFPEKKKAIHKVALESPRQPYGSPFFLPKIDVRALRLKSQLFPNLMKLSKLTKKKKQAVGVRKKRKVLTWGFDLRKQA